MSFPSRIILGFYGPRDGMSEAQAEQVKRLVRLFNPTAAHHGHSLGADEQFHKMLNRNRTTIIAHPCDQTPWRATLDPSPQLVMAIKPAWTRIRNIINMSNVLIITPRVLRNASGRPAFASKSSTMYATTYARQCLMFIYVVRDDGDITKYAEVSSSIEEMP